MGCARRRRSIVAALLLGYGCAVACGPSADAPPCDPARESCEPQLGPCVERNAPEDERSCAEICESLDAACAARACDGQTYMRFMGCIDDDHDGGLASSLDCEDPIEWQLANSVQCCCVGVDP